MRLIVTEKDSAAQKIAEILGGNVEVKEHGRGRQKVRSYWFDWRDDPAVAIGLRGHVMETVFPDTYRRWSLKYLERMITRARPRLGRRRRQRLHGGRPALGRQGRRRSHHRDRLRPRGRAHRQRGARDPARRRAAAPSARQGRQEEEAAKRQGTRQARRLGARARPLDLGPPARSDRRPSCRAKVVDRHHRARYSALTAEEVQAAFAASRRVDFNLADAAHTRQDIDLIWGAVLTRFMSLASYRYGSDYLSVGRVQTPTLRLIVDRELERRAFVSTPYWEIRAEFEAGGGERFAAEHTGNRFHDLGEAEAALAAAQAPTGDGHRLQGTAAQPRSRRRRSTPRR